MKKIILTLSVLLLLVLAGCNSQSTNTVTTCSDFTCLAEAAKTCAPSVGTIQTYAAFIEPLIFASTQTYEIMAEGDSCKLVVTQVAYEITTTDGSEVSAEMVEMRDSMVAAIIGKQGTCVLTTVEMNTLFSEWSEGIFSTNQMAKCEGELYAIQEI
jgi:uncharacterized lipoprotein NlpE involved in copper resistance